MTITRLEPGKRMSQAVVHNGIAYLAGQVGAPGTSLTEQTTAVLTQIDALLADMADFAAMNAVWDAWVDPANPPARATGEVKLATPDYRVEIIVTAALA